MRLWQIQRCSIQMLEKHPEYCQEVILAKVPDGTEDLQLVLQAWEFERFQSYLKLHMARPIAEPMQAKPSSFGIVNRAVELARLKKSGGQTAG